LRRSELHLASSAPPPSPHRCSMASYSTAVDQPTCAPLGVSWSVDQQWRAPKWGLGSKRKSKSRQLSSCFSFPFSRDLSRHASIKQIGQGLGVFTKILMY
jgi:hypothetical protein